MDTNVLKLLPPVEIESRKILKKCTQANRYLAELKGICGTIPNENILINTLSIQEAKDSSAVENIITTHDELFKEGLFSKAITNSSVKEVYNYSEAIKKGYALVLKTGLLTNNTILEIQSCLEKNRAGFRKLPGTALKNDQTGEIVYEPPQNYQEILKLMGNLEQYINIISSRVFIRFTTVMDARGELLTFSILFSKNVSIFQFYISAAIS